MGRFNALPVILSDSQLRTSLDHRDRLRRSADLAASIVRELSYGCVVLFKRIFLSYEPGIKKRAGSESLFVFLHGLRGHPSIWDRHLSQLETTAKKVDTFAPFVPKMGNCSLEEAAEPILIAIGAWVKDNPKKPVCLLGVSNGGRIATWLEVKLREIAPDTPVKVSTVAAVHFGTPMIAMLKRFGIASWVCSPEIIRELDYGSDKAKELLAQIEAPLGHGIVRDYEFYAGTEDFIYVPDLGCSLPNLGRGEKIHAVNGYGHSSIVSAVAEEQIASCVGWLSSL